VKARRCFAEAVAVLVAFNVARSHGLLGPVPVSAVVLTLAMTLIAWRAGLSAAALGLRRRDVSAGLLYGGVSFAAVLVVLVIAAVLPATNGSLHDSRADISGAHIVYEVVVTIFLGTVIPEELAFRGVLLGSGLQLWGRWRAVLITSVLFGLWHITATLHTRSDNQTAQHAPVAIVVFGAVLVTGAAGVIFCWLRLRSKSLIAPVLAHFATNGLALVVAWFAVH
jgi:uncharacterized protein